MSAGLSSVQAFMRAKHITSLKRQQTMLPHRQWLITSFIWGIVSLWSCLPILLDGFNMQGYYSPVCCHLIRNKALTGMLQGEHILLCLVTDAAFVTMCAFIILRYVKKTQAAIKGAKTRSSTQ